MDDWNALARPDDTDSDLYQQAIPRVKRRLLMRQRRNGLIIGWAISAVLAILLGVILRNVAITLIVFGTMAFFFLLAFLVDYYHMDEQERRQRWLAAELDKEVEPPNWIKKSSYCAASRPSSSGTSFTAWAMTANWKRLIQASSL